VYFSILDCLIILSILFSLAKIALATLKIHTCTPGYFESGKRKKKKKIESNDIRRREIW
jgi:hypothetical protein